MKNVIGFTGTREGMTKKQKITLAKIIIRIGTSSNRVCLHGDCIGADAEFHEISLNLGSKIVIHPPNNPKYRAFCSGEGVIVKPEKGYHKRNMNIVNSCDLLIVAPQTGQETLRSGTWSTVRYAKKIGRRAYVVTPEGDMRTDDL